MNSGDPKKDPWKWWGPIIVIAMVGLLMFWSNGQVTACILETDRSLCPGDKK